MVWWHRDIFRHDMPQQEAKCHKLILTAMNLTNSDVLRKENVRVVIIILLFSSAFYLSSAFSHPRFIFYPPFLIRVLSFIRYFSSAFYLSSAISHPRFIFHPLFLIRVLSFIRHFSSAFYLSSVFSHPPSVSVIRVLSSPVTPLQQFQLKRQV